MALPNNRIKMLRTILAGRDNEIFHLRKLKDKECLTPGRFYLPIKKVKLLTTCE